MHTYERENVNFAHFDSFTAQDSIKGITVASTCPELAEHGTETKHLCPGHSVHISVWKCVLLMVELQLTNVLKGESL